MPRRNTTRQRKLKETPTLEQPTPSEIALLDEPMQPLPEDEIPFGDSPADVPAGTRPAGSGPHADLVMVRIEDIDDSRNIRDPAPDDSRLELGASIDALGMLQPVIVRKVGGLLRLVAGHRRLAAAKAVGELYIEAKVYNRVDDQWEARARLAENVQRLGLNHMELAREFGRGQAAGLSVRSISDAANLSDDHVRRHLSLLRLAEPVARLVSSGRLPVQQAELIARVGDPAGQIELADETLQMRWNPRSAAFQDLVPEGRQDYVMPTGHLRAAVARRMRGMAACGWPMGEEYAGKRACAGCPDNTLTYADQPMLFAGIDPAGSAKKGHCTNDPCYQVKVKAWDKVLEQRREDKAKARAAAIRKAQKAGLDICEQCGKVAVEGEAFERCKDLGGVKACPGCAEKAAKRGGRFGGGGATPKRAKPFPDTPAERFAVALHGHAVELSNVITAWAAKAKAVAEDPVSATAELFALAACGEHLGEYGGSIRMEIGHKAAMKPAALLVLLGSGEQIPFPATLPALLAGALGEFGEFRPICYTHDGKVDNIPLAKPFVEFISALEAFCDRHKIDRDARPGPPAVAVKAAKKAAPPAAVEDDARITDRAAYDLIVLGRKPEASAAIASCEDASLLKACHEARLAALAKAAKGAKA